MNLSQALESLKGIIWILSIMGSSFGHPRVKSNLRNNFYTVFGKSINDDANYLIKRHVTSECR